MRALVRREATLLKRLASVSPNAYSQRARSAPGPPQSATSHTLAREVMDLCVKGRYQAVLETGTWLEGEGRGDVLEEVVLRSVLR